MNAKAVFGMPWWQSALFGAGLGALGIGVYDALPAPSLDRAQAAFEADESWQQGRGYNWPKFHAEAGLDGPLHCQEAPDKTVRQCILMMPTFDPKSGEPLGVMPQEFLCTTSSCTWLENFR